MGEFSVANVSKSGGNTLPEWVVGGWIFLLKKRKKKWARLPINEDHGPLSSIIKEGESMSNA